jgi:multidrug efflux pump subunit AcrA (membrane-fusion protein)
MKRTTLIILSLFIFLASCSDKLEKTKPTRENITESVYASGVIKSKNQYKVFSLANGLIDKILVSEGDLVKKGDVLIRLVNTSTELNTENAKLSADYAAVAANSEKLDELKISIEMARNKMENDNLLYQKQKNLWAERIGTQNELDLKELNAKSSTNAYNTAKLRFTNLQKQINFQAKQSQKTLELAQKTNNDFSIRSEINGKVYQLLMEAGEMVNTLSPVAIIGDDSAFLLELQVDEYDINRVKIGQKIAMSMDSYKGQVFQCLVSKINPIMNERTKSFTIEASFIDPPKTLYPNLTCEANIIIQQKTNSITIPRAYLLEGNYVYLKKNKKTKVVTGLKDYQKVEILGGISTNDYIYKPIE